MTKKRRMFDIEVPLDLETKAFPVGKVPDKALKRGPMATAISENAEALQARQTAEDAIRAENDGLAHEYVRLKQAGLIVDMIPLDKVVAERLFRDRRGGDDLELAELKASIRIIGLSNPIRVERRADGRYELIQGMRRLTAYRELYAETGDDAYAAIPAGIMSTGMDLRGMYRRMVDENLVRKDVSFAEMADLARNYAADPDVACEDVDQAVAELFSSAAYSKRSNIRSFAELLDRLDKWLMYPQMIPRNLGLLLRKRIETAPEILAPLTRELRDWPNRSVEDELSLLRRYAEADGVPQARDRSGKAAPQATRRAKTTFQVTTGVGLARCTAAAGRLEIRLDRDFSALDRRRLEAAIAAMLREL